MAIKWKNAGQIHRYSTELAWPDVHCASKICNDGLCKYVAKETAGITDEWLCMNVAPNIAASFGNGVGVILAKPLLWAAFDVEWSERLSPEIKHMILSAFICLELNAIMRDPVQIVEIIAMVTGHSKYILYIRIHSVHTK